MKVTFIRFASNLRKRTGGFPYGVAFAYCQDIDGTHEHIRNIRSKEKLQGVNMSSTPLCGASLKGGQDIRYVTSFQVYERYFNDQQSESRKKKLCLECADYAVETAGYYG